ncbi:MAG TPA: hypothetical protein PKH54_00175 [Myxococcota bacterium]|nr:hypothetical protein [Myxococcota bacterium]
MTRKVPASARQTAAMTVTTFVVLTCCGRAYGQWPRFDAGAQSEPDVEIESLLPGQAPRPRPATQPPRPGLVPEAIDQRCGKFGWSLAEPVMIPVAFPLVLDLTLYGELEPDAVRMADAMAEQLAATGIFMVNNRDIAPAGGAITWASPVAFDYLGWRSAGNWMVVTATIAPPSGDTTDKEKLTVSLSAWLTEEGNSLQVSSSTATVRKDELISFCGRFVDAVGQCVSGIPSAASSRIAYSKRTPPHGVKEIWVTRVGSAEQTRISSDGKLAMLPAWAPGGSLAWTGYRNDNPDLYVDGVRFGNRPGMNTGIAWAPDGGRAAVTWADEGASDIYLVNPVSGEIISRLTSWPGIETSPSWSPDSKQIAFVSDRGGSPGIFVMNADGSGARPLPLDGDYNTGPDWSPDGKTILYQSRGAGSRFSIHAFDVLSGTSKRLSTDNFNNEEPSWSPDGRFIAYTSTRDGRKKLFIMNRDGSGVRQVFKDGDEYFTPAWERVIPKK